MTGQTTAVHSNTGFVWLLHSSRSPVCLVDSLLTSFHMNYCYHVRSVN